MPLPPTVRVHGVPIHPVTLPQAVSLALKKRPAPCFVVTPNALMLDACRRDASLSALLSRADLSLADGKGLLLAARLQGTPLPCRVAGISFGEALLARAAREGLRVFLLGGSKGVAARAAIRLKQRHPALAVCGTHDGYFEKTGTANDRVLASVRAARPDILFVCFGFPLQERWIAANLSHLHGVRVIAGLGGSLDVWSGDLARAPAWVSSVGLEWAWRMLRQPRRLKSLPALVRGVFL